MGVATSRNAVKSVLGVLLYSSMFRMAVMVSTKIGCKQSEFQCQNSRCVPSNRFCNSVNDCGDNSDEPRFCSPCNRTYFGDIGTTYELEIHRPKINQLPFVCSLTFTGGGEILGDIVQITFSRFTLGRFNSFTGPGGCQDGEMQISESERPFIGGSWCGNLLKPTHYFSESSSVKVTIKLHKLPDDNDDYNYDIRITYRMLSKKDSAIRYGGRIFDSRTTLHQNETFTDNRSSRLSYFLGNLIAGTYCSRIFSDCDQKECSLQSPNFPGLYPRNLTCYYAVRQHDVPHNKHALISIQQMKSQLLSIQSLQYTENQHETKLKFWHDCDFVQDYVTVYDGYTTRDPVLIKFCGGGSALPEVISSGPELLVEFSTSPYGTMLNPSHLLPLHGFQLDVKVYFVDKDSWLYTHNKRCEFWIQGSANGILESPKHTLPPNTTCLYHLQGIEPGSTPPVKYQDYSRWKTQTRYKVWISILKFHAFGPENNSLSFKEEKDCTTQLQIWDANIRSPSVCGEICRKEQNVSYLNEHLLARYCRNLVPRSCEHALLQKNLARPCSLSESFLSKKNAMTLEMKIMESSALRPVSFRALYEFVDLHQDGESWGTGPCDRKFQSKTQVISKPPYTFSTPRDVFLYGRGGSSNISCIYRFEGQRGEKLKITITKLNFGNRTNCYSRNNKDSRNLQCIGSSSAILTFFEVPFKEAQPLPKDCLCSGMKKFLPFVYKSSSNVVHVQFSITDMTFTEDYRHNFAEGTYEFVRAPVCTESHTVTGSSGELHFRSPSRTPTQVNCEGMPWLIKPQGDHFLYLKMHGVLMPGSQQIVSSNISDPVECSTMNRVFVYSGSTVQALICPLPIPSQRHHIVEVFSEGWILGTNAPTTTNWYEFALKNKTRNIIVEFLPIENGSYHVSWLELSKRHIILPPHGLTFSKEECFHRCPELNGCINSSLWCDGIDHCPSGYDESIRHCFFLFHMPALYLIILAIVVVTLTCSLIIICYKCYKHQTGLKSSPEAEAIFGPREVIC